MAFARGRNHRIPQWAIKQDEAGRERSAWTAYKQIKRDRTRMSELKALPPSSVQARNRYVPDLSEA